MRRIDTPVLIIGGGGAGLSASIFLTDLGVESLLVERHAGTSQLPKAHYINQRSMEIFALHGAADAVYASAAPRENHGKIIWMTSLGGDGPLDRRVIAEADIMGGGGVCDAYDAKGLTHPTHIPQLRLEPVLRDVAVQRGARMLFRHQFESLVQNDVGVAATVRDLEADELIEVNAQYVVAADGGRSVGPCLSIEMQGMTGMADFIMAWFTGDLDEYVTDNRAVMHMFVHPERAQSGRYAGALLTLGPTRWDGRSEEWGAVWMTQPDDPDRLDMSNAVDAIHDFFKFDAPIEVKHVSHWSLETVIADRFSEGRVLLIGDAAHRQTPGSGLGLNSGIQDAHNLAWKLKLVLGGSSASLLDTYESERRPVIARNVEWSLFSMSNMALPMAAMGLSPVLPREVNEFEFSKLFLDTPEGETRRVRLAEVFRTQRVEYAAHDMEMGFTYADGALVTDGSEPAWRDPMGAEYRPTSRPGSRLPHAWLDHAGTSRSTHQLIPLGGFLLLTGADGDAWCAAAAKVAAELDVVVEAVRVGEGADATDATGQWEAHADIDDDGAILVRPDGHVGFRSRTSVTDHYVELLSACSTITDRDARRGA